MASAGTYRETGTAMSCRVIPVSAALMLLLVSIVQVVSGNNMTLEDVLSFLHNSSSSGSSSGSTIVTSLGDEGTNDDNNRSVAISGAVGSDTEQLLRSGAVSEWLSQLRSNEDDDALSSWSSSSSSSSSSYVSNSILARFIQQVTNRTALCQLLNGTCVVPANCAVLGLTLGYDYGRGSSSDVGKYFSCNDTSTICCYPFLLHRLSSPLYTHYHSDNDAEDEHHQLDGFETVYEYWYPNNRRQRRWRRPTTARRRNRYNGRQRGYDRFSRRKYRGKDRSAFFRSSGSLTDYSPMYYFAAGYAADVDGVNYTAVCESRGGMCTRAADCATNSAVDLSGTGSRYAGQAADYVDNDQIRSFLCNLTSICCLPKPTDANTGRPHIGYPGLSLSQQVAGEFSSVMCALINGTCLPASQCLTSGLTGALYGRSVNFRCKPTRVCCLR